MIEEPRFPIMDLSKWRQLARVGKAPTDVTLRKAEVGVESVGADRIARFVISTAAVDRDMDTIAVRGWDLRHYQKNPVVMWAHDYSQLPVGKALGLTADFTRLLATAQFTPPEVYAFGATVYDMLREGFLRGTSVGFRPIKWALNEQRGGTDFLEQELLEFSIVPVPANPEALIQAAKKSFDRGRVLNWVKSGSVPHAEGEDLVDVDDELRDGLIQEAYGAVLRRELPAVLTSVLGRQLMWVTGRVPDRERRR